MDIILKLKDDERVGEAKADGTVWPLKAYDGSVYDKKTASMRYLQHPDGHTCFVVLPPNHDSEHLVVRFEQAPEPEAVSVPVEPAPEAANPPAEGDAPPDKPKRRGAV